MVSLGTTDAKDGDMFSDFEAWEDLTLWPAVNQQFGGSEVTETSLPLQLTFSNPRASDLKQEVKECLVDDARRLTKSEGAGEKRHLELQLPTGWNYAAGDYLAVLPHNPREAVGRVMRRFRLAWDAHVCIQTTHPTSLPTNLNLPVSEILSSYVELNQAATKRVSRGSPDFTWPSMAA